MTHRLLRERLGQVTDVADDDQRSPPPLVDAGRGEFQVVTPPGVEHNVAPCVRETPGDRAADALSRAGHHGDTSGQVESIEQVRGHAGVPLSRGRN